MTRSSMAPNITEHNDAAFWLAGIHDRPRGHRQGWRCRHPAVGARSSTVMVDTHPKIAGLTDRTRHPLPAGLISLTCNEMCTC